MMEFYSGVDSMTETTTGDIDKGPDLDEQSIRIRDLNDNLRCTFSGGQIMLTAGIDSLPQDIQARVFKTIQEFDGFSEDCDPYGTHEFGSVEVDSKNVWFKIDTYDQNHEYHSPDAADPTVTKRVMTILLPEEY